MPTFLSAPQTWGQTLITVHRCDRWSIQRRLQELDIPCDCPADGTLRVDVSDAVALMLVHSIVRRFTLSRGEAADWLDRCWTTQVPCERR